jgi:hypothetical protein
LKIFSKSFYAKFKIGEPCFSIQLFLNFSRFNFNIILGSPSDHVPWETGPSSSAAFTNPVFVPATMNTTYGNGVPLQSSERPRLFGTALPPIPDLPSVENERFRRRHRHRRQSGERSDHNADFRDRIARAIAFPWGQTSSSATSQGRMQRQSIQVKYGLGARANSPAHPSVSMKIRHLGGGDPDNCPL